MKLPKQTNANPEFVMQRRRESILCSFRLRMGFQVRDAEREQKIESIILAEYGSDVRDLERAERDMDNCIIRFEFASKNPLEQHGVLIIGEKRLTI